MLFDPSRHELLLALPWDENEFVPASVGLWPMPNPGSHLRAGGHRTRVTSIRLRTRNSQPRLCTMAPAALCGHFTTYKTWVLCAYSATTSSPR
jgi:hypothetical protein